MNLLYKKLSREIEFHLSWRDLIILLVGRAVRHGIYTLKRG